MSMDFPQIRRRIFRSFHKNFTLFWYTEAGSAYLPAMEPIKTGKDM